MSPAYPQDDKAIVALREIGELITKGCDILESEISYKEKVVDLTEKVLLEINEILNRFEESQPLVPENIQQEDTHV